MSDIFGSPSKSASSTQTNSLSNSTSTSSGGSSSDSSSGNIAFSGLLNSLGPMLNSGMGAVNQFSNLLGLNGATGQNSAFDNFRNSTGYQFGLDQGSQAITQNNAAKGLLNSGATAKALDTYGQNYANTQYQNYINPLMSLINSGNTANGIIGNAGQQSSSHSTSQYGSNSNSNSNSSGIGLTDSRGQAQSNADSIGNALSDAAKLIGF